MIIIIVVIIYAAVQQMNASANCYSYITSLLSVCL